MDPEYTPLHGTELDATNFLEWRERIAAFEADPTPIKLRTYPGYPQWPLLRISGPRPLAATRDRCADAPTILQASSALDRNALIET